MIGKAELDVQNVTVRYGMISALTRASARIATGEIVALIGPNGAGKTTFLNSISGLLAPSEGAIKLRGEEIIEKSADQRARLGLARTFQHARLMTDLSAIENVLLGARVGNATSSTFSEWCRMPSSNARLRSQRAEAFAILTDLGLAARANVATGQLSFGQRKMVDLARAMIGKPSVLLMDEPTAGLSETEIEQLADTVRKIRGEMAVLVVAHHMGFVAGIADRIICLVGGRVIADGPSREVRADPNVLAAYMGTASP